MPIEVERSCPRCDAEQTFWRTASTELHLGEKTKWECAECSYGLVDIDGDISSA